MNGYPDDQSLLGPGSTDSVGGQLGIDTSDESGLLYSTIKLHKYDESYRHRRCSKRLENDTTVATVTVIKVTKFVATVTTVTLLLLQNVAIVTTVTTVNVATVIITVTADATCCNCYNCCPFKAA